MGAPQRRARHFHLLSPHSQPALDALRAIAAIAVLVTHVGFQTGATQQGRLGAVVARLDSGVAVFFVLSGYLLTSPYVKAAGERRSPPSTRRYFWHRALRILPAYWVACLVAYFFLPENRNVPVSTLLSNLGLVQIYRRGNLLEGFTQTWSLATEVAFYLVLPLLAMVLVSSLRRGRLGSVLAVLGVLVALNVGFVCITQGTDLLDRSLTGFWLPSFTSWFAAGMALAVLRRGTQPALARARSWLDAAAGSPLGCWTIAAGTLLVASTPLAGPRGFEAVPSAGEAVAKNLLYLLVAVSLMIPLAFGQDHPGTFVRWLGAPSWRFLGEISYGMFLWHLIVLTAVLHLRGDRLFGGDFIPVLALTLTGTVLLATTSLLVLERPALKLRDWGPGRRTPSQAVRPDEGGIEATAASAAATQS